MVARTCPACRKQDAFEELRCQGAAVLQDRHGATYVSPNGFDPALVRMIPLPFWRCNACHFVGLFDFKRRIR